MTYISPHELLVRDQDGELRLVAGKRKNDGRMVFPIPGGTDAALFDEVVLPAKGTLWSYTVQRFQPKSPYAGAESAQEFQPYAVGYVEFPGFVIVEGRIVTGNPSELRIGMPMQVTTEPFHLRSPDEEASGLTRIFAFEPTAPRGQTS